VGSSLEDLDWMVSHGVFVDSMVGMLQFYNLDQFEWLRNENILLHSSPLMITANELDGSMYGFRKDFDADKLGLMQPIVLMNVPEFDSVWRSLCKMR